MEQLRCGKCGKEITGWYITCPVCNKSLKDEWSAVAQAGFPKAQNFLAWRYFKGDGVEKDDVQAAKWWSLAAAQGNIAATNSLGGCYFNGLGMEKDRTKAIELFRIAADQGFAKAQYNLGLCYRFGYGVEKDLEEAAKWYGMAEKQFDVPSIIALQEMEKEKEKEEEEMPEEPSQSTYNPDILYCNHSDHIKAIMHPTTLVTGYLGRIINKSDVYKTFDTMMPIKNTKSEPTKLCALRYEGEDCGFISLIASNNKMRSNMFIALFPLLKGNVCELEIEKVWKWANQVEATIKARIGNRSIAFFATDYYFNKEKYKAGERMNVSLAALGMHVDEGLKGFDMVYFPEETHSRDNAQFQSPACDISRSAILDINFVKCRIAVPTQDKDDTISIPLYFRESFLPGIAEGTPISGSLWLTGQIYNSFNAMAAHASASANAW